MLIFNIPPITRKQTVLFDGHHVDGYGAYSDFFISTRFDYDNYTVADHVFFNDNVVNCDGYCSVNFQSSLDRTDFRGVYLDTKIDVTRCKQLVIYAASVASLYELEDIENSLGVGLFRFPMNVGMYASTASAWSNIPLLYCEDYYSDICPGNLSKLVLDVSNLTGEYNIGFNVDHSYNQNMRYFKMFLGEIFLI